MEHAFEFEQHMEENRTEDEPRDQQDDEGNEAIHDYEQTRNDALCDLLLNFNRKLTERQRMENMQAVKLWEHRNTNSAEYIVAHLECGHERTFNGNTPLVGNKLVRCWVCDKEDKSNA